MPRADELIKEIISMQPQQYPPQPQYPAQPSAPQYPQQPQQGYPAPAQPAYPPQGYGQPQQPQFPVQPAYPPQGYGQPAYPQQFPQPQAPAQPLPAGSLDSFYQQPSASGGPSFRFMDANRQPQIGKSYEGFVARPITDGDVRPQTDQGGNVRTYKDGRPKFVLVVPMQVQPSEEFPEGQAGWWVKGQARDELARAMGEAGAPAGAPEAGAFIRVTLVSLRPVPNMNPAFQYRVEYVRPQGAVPAQAPQQAPAAATAQPQPVPAQAPTQQYPPLAAPVMSTATGQPVMHQQPVPAAPAAAPAPVPQQAPAAPAAAVVPTGFSPEQQALLAKLTGQSAG